MDEVEDVVTSVSKIGVFLMFVSICGHLRQ